MYGEKERMIDGMTEKYQSKIENKNTRSRMVFLHEGKRNDKKIRILISYLKHASFIRYT